VSLSIKLELDGDLNDHGSTTPGHMLGGLNWGETQDQRQRWLYMKCLQRLLGMIRESCGFHIIRQDAVCHKTIVDHLWTVRQGISVSCVQAAVRTFLVHKRDIAVAKRMQQAHAKQFVK